MDNFLNKKPSDNKYNLFSSHLPGFNFLSSKLNHDSNSVYFNYDQYLLSNINSNKLLQKSNLSNINNLNSNINNFEVDTINSTTNPSNNTNNMNISIKDKNNFNSNTLKFFEFEESLESKHKKMATASSKKKQALSSTDKSSYNAMIKKKKEEALRAQYYNPKKNTIEHLHNLGLITEYNKQNLDKFLVDADEIKREDSEVYGTLYSFSNRFRRDFLNPLAPRPLVEENNYNNYKTIQFYDNLSPDQDENLKTIDGFNIYITDKILSYIMTMNFHSHSWHINIKKDNGKMFFFTDSNSDTFLTTVDESSFTPDFESNVNLNKFESLANEATLINNIIKEVVLDKPIRNSATRKYNKHPFNQTKKETKKTSKNEEDEEDEEEEIEEEEAKDNTVENSVYSYQAWSISNVKVLVRCNIHCGKIEKVNDEEVLKKINVYALNEYNVSFSKQIKF